VIVSLDKTLIHRLELFKTFDQLQ